MTINILEKENGPNLQWEMGVGVDDAIALLTVPNLGNLVVSFRNIAFTALD